jgi:6-pyruvoyltetrahydropterin/6-carboxytetrahydropterin synthase
MLSVTKEFSFEMAHQLDGYNGKCRNVHGHSYRLAVCVCGCQNADPQHPHYGMVVDFADLKRIVEEEIIALYDHCLILRQDTRLYETMQHTDMRILAVEYQPTCENLLLDIVQRLQHKMPAGIRLHSARLYETATSWAEWTRDT